MIRPSLQCRDKAINDALPPTQTVFVEGNINSSCQSSGVCCYAKWVHHLSGGRPCTPCIARLQSPPIPQVLQRDCIECAHGDKECTAQTCQVVYECFENKSYMYCRRRIPASIEKNNSSTFSGYPKGVTRHPPGWGDLQALRRESGVWTWCDVL